MWNGILVVPVEINGAVTLDFAVDSGAAYVSVPAGAFSTLKHAGASMADELSRELRAVRSDWQCVSSCRPFDAQRERSELISRPRSGYGAERARWRIAFTVRGAVRAPGKNLSARVVF
jgi:hypothetical protein